MAPPASFILPFALSIAPSFLSSLLLLPGTSAPSVAVTARLAPFDAAGHQSDTPCSRAGQDQDRGTWDVAPRRLVSPGRTSRGREAYLPGPPSPRTALTPSAARAASRSGNGRRRGRGADAPAGSKVGMV